MQQRLVPERCVYTSWWSCCLLLHGACPQAQQPSEAGTAITEIAQPPARATAAVGAVQPQVMIDEAGAVVVAGHSLQVQAGQADHEGYTRCVD